MDKSVAIAGGILGIAVCLVALTVLAAPNDAGRGTLPNALTTDNTLGANGTEEGDPIVISRPWPGWPTQSGANGTEEAGPIFTQSSALSHPYDADAPPAEPFSLVEIFEMTEAGTVRVEVRRDNVPLSSNTVGSGFVFDARGHIITNEHVIDRAEKIVVTFLDGRSYNAEVIGKDPFTDIAVIKVDADTDLLKPLLLGDSSYLKVGEEIAAIGNPFGLSGSMTSGIVSQLGRLLPTQEGAFSIPDVIQTDAAINPGNSGGPLLNTWGEVVGINTAIQSATGEFTGVGFAVPSQTLAKIVPVLIKDGRYDHPWLGITGMDVDPDIAAAMNLVDTKGFVVVSVVENSPAERAGLHGATSVVMIDDVDYQIGGDVIVAVDGFEVRKIDDILIYLQRQKSVGDDLFVDVIRDGRITTLVLVLEKRPDF